MSTNKETIHQYYMRVAQSTAVRSTCLDKRVGCVITDKDKNIIATGYNGNPRGYSHCANNGYCAKTIIDPLPCLAIHAEINAIIKCADISEIYAIYVTLSPCLEGLKIILNTSCKYIYYSEESKKSSIAKTIWLMAKANNTWVHEIVH